MEFLMKNIKSLLISFFLLIWSSNVFAQTEPYIIILGNAQDAGFPQIACNKKCCKKAWKKQKLQRHATCFAVINPATKKSYLFEATPDIKWQLQMLKKHMNDKTHLPSAIILTHAHIGHYSGLLMLGKEAMSTDRMPVYAMPMMKKFLSSNGPWSQLVDQKQITLNGITEEKEYQLDESIRIKAFRVPHRDEFSETVGYIIYFNNKKICFIPDIDKWNKWEKDLTELVRENNTLIIDGTFYKDGELKNRTMKEVPHPFITETMDKLNDMNAEEKAKVYFIHFNHTNPVLRNGKQRKSVFKNGFRICDEGMILK